MPDKQLYPHEYWHGNAVHSLMAHVRLQGKQFQIDLGVPEEEIKGTGARTHPDAIILALAWKAGFKMEHLQDEPNTDGTPNENHAATHAFSKRAGRPAGPSATKAGGGANAAPASSREEVISKAARDRAVAVLQRAWRGKRGRFTSRGTAIVAPTRVAMVEVRIIAFLCGSQPFVHASDRPSMPCALLMSCVSLYLSLATPWLNSPHVRVCVVDTIPVLCHGMCLCAVQGAPAV